MNKLQAFKRFGVSGFVAVAGLAGMIPQAAQAGTAEAEAIVQFDDVQIQLLNGAGAVLIPNLWNISVAEVSTGASASQPISPDLNSVGLTPCPVTPIAVVSAAGSGPAFSDSSAFVDCSTPFADAGNSAFAFATGDDEEASAFGEYTIVSELFTVQAGDTLDVIQGTFFGSVFAEVTDFEIPIKAAEANYIATYDIFLDDVLVNGAPVLTNTASVLNTNGTLGPLVDTADFGDPLAPDFVDLDYTFLQDGEARIAFFAREEAAVTVNRTTPEPSTVLGLLGVMGAGIFSNRRRKKQ